MPQVLDIEQAVLLLEIEPPFDKRDIQLARRRLAKRWHPDIAPPRKAPAPERAPKGGTRARRSAPPAQPRAKRWHPDIAPPGKQLEHERHLKAVNEAADQLERLAEDSRGGSVSGNAATGRA